MLWVSLAVGVGVACVLAVAVVMHLWLKRLNAHLRDSVQAALERQRDNQHKLADSLQRLDSDLGEVRRRLRALEAGQVASESPSSGGESGSGTDADATPDGDASDPSPRRFLH